MPKTRNIPAAASPAPAQLKETGAAAVNHPLLGWVVMLCAFALYVNTTANDYALDDWGAITGNPYVQEGFSGLPKIFSSDFWHITNIRLGYYRPLAPATFAIEQQFLHGNPHASHFINALLFAFSGLALYRLLRKLFASRHFLLPFTACMLYIAHPIHTEVVANIKGRDELLSCLNILLAVWYGLRYTESKKWPQLLLSLLFAYLSLLSKESGLIVIVLLPLVLYYRNFSIKNSLKSALPYLAVIILFFVQKSYALGDLSVNIPVDPVNYPYTAEGAGLPTSILLFVFSLRLLIFPHPLRYDYSFNQIPPADWRSPAVLLGVLLLLLAAYLAYRHLQKRTAWGFALGLFFITLVPGLAFTLLRGGIFAERFLYMPSLAFCIALAYTLILFLKPSSLKELKFAAPVLILFLLYSVKTISRNTVWKDNYTLMSTDVETGAKSAQNQRHYGDQLINKANAEKDPVIRLQLARRSILAFQKALRIYPKFGDAYCEMGITYHTLIGNLDSAVYCYNKAIECAPALEKAYYYLGTIYETSLQKKNVASFYYNEAIRQNPEFTEAQTAAERMKKEGLDVHMNPLTATVDSSAIKDQEYYFRMGNYYAAQADYRQAAENFAKSIELKKDNEDAYINLANCYGMLKEYEKSLAVAKEFLATHPDNGRILKNMSVTYNFLGNKEESERCLKRAKEVLGE
jgi:tetratricopeptide (TPR) repeat protein